MLSVFSKENFKTLCDETASKDEHLKFILKNHGYPPMWSRPNTFESLVHIILEQQVSLASALSALNKLREFVTQITPANILKLTDVELKACYFSRQKTIYVRALATAIENGSVSLEDMERLTDDEVRGQLITIKGIGHWTIDVYLIFVLNRADIFPAGDLAAVKALHKLLNLPKGTSREQLHHVSLTWSPYRTIATMLLWHYYLSAPRKK